MVGFIWCAHTHAYWPSIKCAQFPQLLSGKCYNRLTILLWCNSGGAADRLESLRPGLSWFLLGTRTQRHVTPGKQERN